MSDSRNLNVDDVFVVDSDISDIKSELEVNVLYTNDDGRINKDFLSKTVMPDEFYLMLGDEIHITRLDLENKMVYFKRTYHDIVGRRMPGFLNQALSFNYFNLLLPRLKRIGGRSMLRRARNSVTGAVSGAVSGLTGLSRRVADHMRAREEARREAERVAAETRAAARAEAARRKATERAARAAAQRTIRARERERAAMSKLVRNSRRMGMAGNLRTMSGRAIAARLQNRKKKSQAKTSKRAAQVRAAHPGAKGAELKRALANNRARRSPGSSLVSAMMSPDEEERAFRRAHAIVEFPGSSPYGYRAINLAPKTAESGGGAAAPGAAAPGAAAPSFVNSVDQRHPLLRTELPPSPPVNLTESVYGPGYGRRPSSKRRKRRSGKKRRITKRRM